MYLVYNTNLTHVSTQKVDARNFKDKEYRNEYALRHLHVWNLCNNKKMTVLYL